MKENILVVDDDLAILDGFEGILVKQGFFVDKAFDEKEALDKLNTKHYDVVIVDIVLKETNGIELIKQISRGFNEKVVIALTGYPCADYAVGSFHNGAFEFLTKPCSQETLFEAIARGLAKRNTNGLIYKNNHDFSWQKIIHDNPTCIDKIMAYAKQNVSKDVFSKIRNCEENFQCVTAEKPEVCAGESYLEKECCFIKKEGKKICNSRNQLSFGYGYFCSCPIRCELYKEKII